MMLTSTLDLVNLDVGSAAVMALLGYAVVFFGLILLMILVTILGKIFMAAQNRKGKTVAVEPAEPVAEPVQVAAPGAAGQLKLHNVDPKTAAMLMAIVANKLQKPMNELRFVSIKEVEQ